MGGAVRFVSWGYGYSTALDALLCPSLLVHGRYVYAKRYSFANLPSLSLISSEKRKRIHVPQINNLLPFPLSQKSFDIDNQRLPA